MKQRFAFPVDLPLRRTILSPSGLFAASLLLTLLIYWPGLSGGFLFDDYPNLEQLGARGPIVSFELVKDYLASGFSGPTGRPISLLSFLLDANDWPADPQDFKRTNVLLHLLVGLLVYLTSRRMLLSIGRTVEEAAWVGVLAATLWLVNPFLVSTTLYVVQRMTQLAALFVLAGFWCYLRGRALLASNSLRGYLLLTVSLPLFTFLATFSKENGALLPLLVLVAHVTLKDEWTIPRPARAWTVMLLALPSAAIAAYLLSTLPGADHAFASREFSLGDRLLSQPRILMDYLFHIFVPHIQTNGLYNDGRIPSTALLQPWTTLPGLIGLIALVTTAFVARRRLPLLSFSISFFLAGHLLESTVIPLELYFEHRNYLPSAFLFLPVAAVLHGARRGPLKPSSVGMLAALATAVYAGATWQRASLWGNTDQLLLVWAQMNPTSARAQVSAAQVWLRNDKPANALRQLEEAARNKPNDALVLSNLLAFQTETGQLTAEEFEAGAVKIRHAEFDPQAMIALELLVDMLNRRGPLPDHARVLHDLLADVRRDAGTTPPIPQFTLYLQGMLYAGQGRPQESMPYFREALHLYDSVEAGLRIVSELAVLEDYRQALEILELCDALLSKKDDSQLLRSKRIYEREIERIRSNLLHDLDAKRAIASGTSASPDDADRAKP